MSVGVAVITHNARHHLPHCLPPLLNSPLKPKVLVVNSSSSDGTRELAKDMGAEVMVVPRSSFNHGLTREAARHALGTEIVVMATPDAYFKDISTLETLIRPIKTGQAKVSYARQLPHAHAQFFESFHRNFNYPNEGHIRGIEDLPIYGVYTFFCSNSASAWDNSALDQIGGFPHVLLGEDTIATISLLRRGEKIAYQADALVHHSHSYTLKQEFQRHFDTGLAREKIRDLLQVSDRGRGFLYAKELIKHASKTKPELLPLALLHLGAKWCGYQLGKRAEKAPVWIKKICSSQDFYWTKKEGESL